MPRYIDLSPFDEINISLESLEEFLRFRGVENSQEILQMARREDLSPLDRLNAVEEALVAEKGPLSAFDSISLRWIALGGEWREYPEDRYPLEERALVALPAHFQKANRCVSAMYLDEKTLVLITVNPFDEEVISFARKRTGANVIPVMSHRGAVERMLRYISEDAEGLFGRISLPSEFRSAKTEEVAVEFVEAVLTTAILNGASDIHIQPLSEKGGFVTRFRIHGDLVEQPDFSNKNEPISPIVARIKILAGMHIQETRRPQDGSFSKNLRGENFEIRVATLPEFWGGADGASYEAVTMRILRRSSSITLDTVGFSPAELALYKELLNSPNGVVLVTGPTGSGKSTTLFATLSSFDTSKLRLYTIEDPVEYRIKGATQISVLPGVREFATVLRALMRSDPDVIMVGEIRDPETALVAFQAAVTGHLVFSTLHTNDSISTISRLLALSNDAFRLEPYVLGSALRGATAQRLVKRLCDSCKVPSKVYGRICELLGIEEGTEVFDVGRGCPRCGGRGYTGRIPVMEVACFKRIPNFEEFVLEYERKAVTLDQLRDELRAKGGFISLLDSARERLLSGKTYPKAIAEMFGKVEG